LPTKKEMAVRAMATAMGRSARINTKRTAKMVKVSISLPE
jgi:hypothetical protein